MGSDVEPATVQIDNCGHTGPNGFSAVWELGVGPTIEAPCFTWRVVLSCGDCGAIFAPDPIRGVHFDRAHRQWVLHAQPLPASAVAPDPPTVQ